MPNVANWRDSELLSLHILFFGQNITALNFHISILAIWIFGNFKNLRGTQIKSVFNCLRGGWSGAGVGVAKNNAGKTAAGTEQVKNLRSDSGVIFLLAEWRGASRLRVERG